MKDKRNTERSAAARFNQAKAHLEKCRTVIYSVNHAKEIDDAAIADLRDFATDFIQCVHEFSAYRNVAEWNGQYRDAYHD